MFRELRRLRTVVALPMMLVMAALAFGVPLLDAEPHPPTPSVQADGAMAGYPDHDHGVCILYGASPWSPAPRADIPAPVLVWMAESPPWSRQCHDPSHSARFHARAPPVA
jgi:hypothetical protein